MLEIAMPLGSKIIIIGAISAQKHNMSGVKSIIGVGNGIKRYSGET